MEDIKENNASNEDGIIFSEILNKIWERRKTVFASIAIFFFLGIIIIIGTPKEYRSDVKLLVESGNSSNMSGLLQQFGGLAGINLGAAPGEDALTPELYPDIVESTPFLLEIMNQKISILKFDTTVLVSDYFNQYMKPSFIKIISSYTIGLPSKILSIFKKDNDKMVFKKNENFPLVLTKRQEEIIKSLSGRIKAREGDSKNILLISVETQDPVISAELTDSVVKCLTKYVIDYRTQKAKSDLQFVTDRHEEAKKRFVQAQKTLAIYRDENKNVISAFANTEEERLQAEYNLAFNVYNTLSQQAEQAKIRVQEKTPVFKVIDPAKVPLQKSKPQTIVILFIMVLIGMLSGITIIFGKTLYLYYTKKDIN